MSRGHEEHQLDSQPLLGDDAPLDTRFALDEDTAYDDNVEAADGNNTAQSHEAPKYPPSSLPPTYTDSVRYRINPSAVGHRFPVLEEHLRHFTSRTKEFLSRLPGPSTARVCYARVCPSARFAQAGLLIAGLWLLVVLTGPAMEAAPSDNGRPNQEPDNIWSSNLFATAGPPPVSGDGHITAHPEWQFHSCASERIPIRRGAADAPEGNWSSRLFDWIRPTHRIVCRSSTSVALRAPISFATTDKLFLFIDPNREHVKRRGKVPAKVTFVVDETLPLHVPKKDSRSSDNERMVPRYRIGKQGHSDTEVIVDIEARYHQDAEDIFRGTTIGKMAAGVFDEGVGIYTWTLPPPLQLRQAFDAPLFLDIKVRIPAGADIPAFYVDGSAVEVDAFTQVARDPKGEPTAASIRFGSFNVQSGRGDLVTDSIHAISHVRLWTDAGAVTVMPNAHLSSPSIQLTTRSGSIEVGRGAQVSGWGEAVLKSSNGDIKLLPGSSVRATKVIARAHRGGFAPVLDNGEVAGTWYANYTLDMRSDNAATFARIDIQPVEQYQLTPEDRRAFVRVDVQTDNGDIDVQYVHHAPSVALHSEIVAKTAGRVDVRHPKEFEGSWSVEGWKGSHAVLPKDLDHGRTFSTDKAKDDGAVAGAGHSYVTGHVALVPSTTAKEANATSNVKSAGGIAVLTFE